MFNHLGAPVAISADAQFGLEFHNICAPVQPYVQMLNHIGALVAICTD